MERAALGRAGLQRNPRGQQRGFSLVELLVVVGIIAILIAILLPVLSRARESARRASCGANLHGIGQTAMQFANDHKGYFPICYREPDPTAPFRFPLMITQITDFDAQATTMQTTLPNWASYGTSWTMFQQYGATEGMFTCPSSVVGFKYFCPASGPVQLPFGPPPASSWVPTPHPQQTCPAEWGQCVWTTYMYVGGLDSATLTFGKSVAHWGMGTNQIDTHSGPAVLNTDPKCARRVLAADAVFFTGGPGYTWDTQAPRYVINHPRRSDPTMPEFQNVLYADGHVEPHQSEEFPNPLNTTDNYSLEQSSMGNVGGFFYWGEPDAVPPPVPPVTLPGQPASSGAGGGAPIQAIPTPPKQPANLPPNPVPPTPFPLNS